MQSPWQPYKSRKVSIPLGFSGFLFVQKLKQSALNIGREKKLLLKEVVDGKQFCKQYRYARSNQSHQAQNPISKIGQLDNSGQAPKQGMKLVALGSPATGGPVCSVT